MFARQRSGTGALGTVLSKHPKLRYIGEVFHPEDRANPLNFFRFLEEAPDQAQAYADPRRREAVIAAFAIKVRARFPKRKAILDVKYQSMQHWNGGWQGLVQPPWILRYGRENSFPVIHLKRSNMLETFVSGRLAEANRVWHAVETSELPVKSLEVNLVDLNSYMVMIAEEVRLVERWLRGYPKLLTLEYANVFEGDGSVSPKVAKSIAQLLEVEDFTELKPGFIKQSPPRPSESVENFDLVRRALSGTEHEWMLTSSLPPA